MLAASARRRFSSIAQLRASYGMWIDGKEVPSASGASFAVLNPATAQPVCRVAEGRAEDVQHAISVARRSFDSGAWSRADPIDRSRVLWNAAQLLSAKVPQIAAQESQQTGRAIREMSQQLGRLPEWLEYFGSLVRVAEGTVPPFKGFV
jgi:acyl-CoA reductase-like NAD-dependent aldehyde dehydrogenase